MAFYKHGQTLALDKLFGRGKYKAMINAGDIISYRQMCVAEKMSLQRGMNFCSGGKDYSVILMSVRNNAPYEDEIIDDGKVLIYEGHDVPSNEAKVPKAVDQEMYSGSGNLTQNGKFYNAAMQFKNKKASTPHFVKVYEKIKKGIWVYNGVFELIDSWIHDTGQRNVFKFRLRISRESHHTKLVHEKMEELDHSRIIPSDVKLMVWKRDKGRCVECGSTDNLHFDHIIPFSKGGTSLMAENIQLLCARHNLNKSNKIL